MTAKLQRLDKLDEKLAELKKLDKIDELVTRLEDHESCIGKLEVRLTQSEAD